MSAFLKAQSVHCTVYCMGFNWNKEHVNSSLMCSDFLQSIAPYFLFPVNTAAYLMLGATKAIIITTWTIFYNQTENSKWYFGAQNCTLRLNIGQNNPNMWNVMLLENNYLYRLAINLHLDNHIPPSLFTGPTMQHERNTRTSLKGMKGSSC